jgi:hypothetical protein
LRRRSSAIHRGLVGERALVGTPYLADPALRAEYARDIAPRTRAALAKILGALYPEGGAPIAPPRRALDLGAGTGAAGEALRARFGAALELVAVDRVASPRAAAPGVVGADLAAELPPVDGRFDLIVAAHLLNELFVNRAPEARTEARARRVLAWAEAFLADGGRVVLVEPALRETSRELLAVRDRLRESPLRIVAPCFWAGPCPALARERDWCHDAAPMAGGGGGRADFTYLVLARKADVEPSPAADLYRVVSDPLGDKGRLRLFVCGGATGRDALVRLDRHATPANAALDALARGDVVRLRDTQRAGDGLRVTPETVVARGGD